MPNKLNKDQLKAIHHKTGPLLVIAGAGTGKTTVITERIKYLIEKGMAKPGEILALTFTEKASQEMQERVDIALPYGYTQMWVMTFHSFCDRVLRAESLHMGMDPSYKLMTQAETIQLIKKNLFTNFKLSYFRPLGNPYKFVEGMIQHFSRLQDEAITPADYLKWAKANGEDNDKELASAYRTYEELKVQNSFLDFGDLITKTIKLFKTRPNILKKYQRQFKYILIDEFQDTNFAQNELAVILANHAARNITVVGDDDQSIYRFRGAAVSNIIQFRKSFPKTKVVVLTKNYRSTQEILDKAYTLIQNNNPDRLEVVEKVNKKLISSKKTGPKIEFMKLPRVEDEADAVAQKIKSFVQTKKYDYKDFAILVRANNHAETFNRALVRHKIPYQFLGPGRLFRQEEILDLISYLRVLYNFDDSVSFHRILSLDVFNISPRDIAKLGNFAKKYNLSLFESAEKAASISISDDSKEKISNLLNMVNRHLALITKESAGQILYYFLTDTNLLKVLLDPQSSESQKKAANISKFFDKIKTYETDHQDAKLDAIVDWIDLSMQIGESPRAADTDWNEVNAVNILTVHSSKGLEFPVVFLVNLVAQRFPTIERREQIPIPDALIKELLPLGDFHLEEERRLFYVGMTRAKDRLFLTAAAYYGEGKREKKLSPFISETLGNSYQENKMSDNKQLSFMDYAPVKKEIKSPSKLKINYLSYSQIETFKTCPMHYKLKYILKVPTPPLAAASFGTSIHNTLKDFYLHIKNGQKPNQQLLFKLLKLNWVKEGFLDKNHEKKFQEKGKKYLSAFLKNEFNPKVLPVLLEESFIIPISKDLKIGGKIDRVDDLGSGQIEIWDYKTGANVPTQKEVDHNLQLTFYALAANSLPEYPFSKSPEKIKLTLYYFENARKITTTRTKSDLLKAKEEILKIRDEIEKSDFKCTGNFLCQNCEYKLFCFTESL